MEAMIVMQMHLAHMAILTFAALGMTAVATRGPIGHPKRATYTMDSGATAAAGLGVIKGALDSSFTNPTGAGQRCRGIVEYTPWNEGLSAPPGGGGTQAVSLVQEGETLAQCGAAVNSDDYIVMTATGAFITSTTQGDEVVGIARSSTVNAGDWFVLDMRPFIR